MTWNKPLPIQIVQAVANPVDHFSSTQLREGNINATLSWQFDLTELVFRSLVIKFNRTTIAGAKSSRSGPQPGFENQFAIDWIPSQNLVKLFIFNVTTKENGTFTCQVDVDAVTGFASFEFRSNVKVDIVGKLQVKFRNI